MLRFSGMPTLGRLLLQTGNELLGDVPDDELGHIAINDSTNAPGLCREPAEVGGEAATADFRAKGVAVFGLVDNPG